MAGIHSSLGYSDVCDGHSVKQIGNRCHFRQMLRKLGKKTLKKEKWGQFPEEAEPPSCAPAAGALEGGSLSCLLHFSLSAMKSTLPMPGSSGWLRTLCEPFPLAPGVPHLLTVAGQEQCSLVPSTLLVSAPASQATVGSKVHPYRR